MNEQDYERGSLMAWQMMLGLCLRHLPRGDERDKAVLVAERADAVAMLRTVCEEVGDANDWPDNLHLSDVIEKHVLRHLDNL